MSRPGRLSVVVVVSIVVVTAILADRPILDTDYFWHLQTGAQISATGEVPRVDAYSYSAPGARWIDLHWLFQVGLFQIYALGGHEANRVAGFVLACAIVGVAALGLWRRDRPALCGVALALLVTAICVRFLLRPDTVSLLLAAIVLALLRRDERVADRRVYAIVPIQLVWANLHGFQAVGLALVAMALAGEAVSSWFGSGAPARRARMGRLGLILALGMLAAVLNPNGVEGALMPLRQLGMLGPAAASNVFARSIDELRPPLAVLDANSAAALAAFGALGVLSLAALLLDRRGFSAFDALAWLAFAVLAFAAVRNTALFALVAAPIFVTHWGRWLDDTQRISAERQRLWAMATAGGLALCAGLLGVGELARADGPRGTTDAAFADFWFPERAVDWIERNRPPGPLYHRMGDGGYLIWRLWPAYPVLVDGRLEVYGERLYEDIEVAGDGGPETFQRLDARHHFGTALIHFGLFRDPSLFAWLDAQPAWRLVALDEVAAVFVRSDAAERAGWPALNVDSPLLFAPLDSEMRHPLDLWRRLSRVSILAALGRIDAARALLDETRSAYPNPQLDAIRAQLSPPGSGWNPSQDQRSFASRLQAVRDLTPAARPAVPAVLRSASAAD